MTRVLHVICDLAGGGAERMVLELASRASGGGHAVAPLHRTGPLRAGFAARGVPLLDLDRERGRPGVAAVLRLSRLARRFDVVHTHLWAGDTWGRLGAALARVPVVVSTEHNTVAEAPWRQRLSVAMHPLSDAVVGVSSAAAERLVTAGVPRDKIEIIHNGVDLSALSPRAPQPRAVRVVLGVGRLTRQKGFDVLATAVAGMPGVSLQLLGEGEESMALQRAGARLLGWRADVRPALSRADVVVVPSRWEGFGLVAVEAMAAGVPVIATAIEGLDEVVGDAALRVPPDDPAAIATALRRLDADPALYRRLSAAGPRRAARFSVDVMVDAYERLYGRLLRRR